MTTSNAKIAGHILVVDDDSEIRDLLSRFLGNHGFRVTTVADGKKMYRALEDWRIDLIVMDLMLPGEDGLSLCRNLRAKSQIPIIMLTMIGEETDRIIGLEMGADDYLPKPFSPRELLARMKAVLRRARGDNALGATGGAISLRFADWKLDIGHRRLESPDGLLVDLSTGEFDLLVVLAEHYQRVLNRDQLLDLTHGRTEALFDRSIDMQISRLRRKIESDHTAPELIKTVRGGGYIFTPVVTYDKTPDT